MSAQNGATGTTGAAGGVSAALTELSSKAQDWTSRAASHVTSALERVADDAVEFVDEHNPPELWLSLSKTQKVAVLVTAGLVAAGGTGALDGWRGWRCRGGVGG